MSKYNVKLDREQREGLEQLMKSGQAPARKLMHARILLKADSTKDGPNWPHTRISEALEVSVPTIWRVRRRFVEQGLDEALNRRPQPERPNKRIFDGEKEAHLIALTCGEKPEGEGHWSMRLLWASLDVEMAPLLHVFLFIIMSFNYVIIDTKSAKRRCLNGYH
jgi:Homeodomain-like domain